MKRISFLLIIVVLLFIIIRLTSSIYTLWHKQDLLTNAQRQLQEEQKENSTLKKQLTTVKSTQFLDEEARNKLLMVKPGESEVIIDPNLLHASSSAQKKQNLSNWQQWWELFF
jgi:cell division protein FtsB